MIFWEVRDDRSPQIEAVCNVKCLTVRCQGFGQVGPCQKTWRGRNSEIWHFRQSLARTVEDVDWYMKNVEDR